GDVMEKARVSRLASIIKEFRNDVRSFNLRTSDKSYEDIQNAVFGFLMACTFLEDAFSSSSPESILKLSLDEYRTAMAQIILWKNDNNLSTTTDSLYLNFICPSSE
ncbi:hypothetical protein KKG05_00615, partial [bacterium]|nr:hypothetical protein [bacterium]